MTILVRVEHKNGDGMYWGLRNSSRTHLDGVTGRIGQRHMPRSHGNPFGEGTRFAFNSKKVFNEILRSALTSEKELLDLGLVIKHIKADRKQKKRLDNKQSVVDMRSVTILKVLRSD